VAEHLPQGLQTFIAPNAGPFTLDGTCTYVVGSKRAVVIDPGPAIESHLRAVAEAVADANEVTILVTHHHPDHSECAADLANRLGVTALGVTALGATALGATVFGPTGDPEALPLFEGQEFSTDVGSLVALSTPGHTEEHWTFHWRDTDSAFVGDLLLGQGKTTWVGEYAGSVGDYLQSMGVLRDLKTSMIFPGHGEAIRDPESRIDLFENHRRSRIDQVRAALAEAPNAQVVELVDVIYGSLEPRLRAAAVHSVEAVLDYLASPE